MANFGKLFSRIWTDPDFTSLDASAQQLYCLLVSYATRDHAGVLPMTLKRWAKCTAGATVETVQDALVALTQAQFVVIDVDTEEVLIRTFIRNDEVYKQPKVMMSALKSALAVESKHIRWALYDELERLPEHAHADDTAAAAKALVDGLSQRSEPPPGNPFRRVSETLPEPFAKAPGVGAYVSTVGQAPTPAPTTFTPTPARAATAEPPPAQPPPTRTKNGAALARQEFAAIATRSLDAYRIAEAFSASLPVPIEPDLLSSIGTQIDKCLKRGIPPPAIAKGLKAWTDSDSWSPTQITSFVHKANNRARNGKPTEKALGYDDALTELLTEVQTL